jgi:hypothetical protein
MAESDLLSSSTLEENAEIPVSTKIPASPEGIAIAYGSLVVMALLPIFFGSFRSVKHHREQRVRMYVAAAGCQLPIPYVLGMIDNKRYVTIND